MRAEIDVLVVGGGIAGSVLATMLKRSGQRVLLAERCAAPRPIFKGEYLQPAVVDFLHETGFGSLFEAGSVQRIRELRFRDVDEEGHVVADLLMKYPRGKSARSISHGDLTGGLFRLNRENLGEDFRSGCTVTPLNPKDPDFLERPLFRLDGPGTGETTEVAPRWVVGCDGRQSAVRKWMGRAVENNAKRDQNVTLGAGREFIMGMELPDPAPKPDRYEVIRVAGRGTLAAFSLNQHGQRLYFSSLPRENLARAAADDIRALLGQVRSIVRLGQAPEKAVAQGSLANTSEFTGCAEGAFLLAGDAAAVTTPYGGQGMTLACEQVRYLGRRFDWSANSTVTRALARYRFERFARKGYDRVHLLNFGLYYLFFARQGLWRYTTAYVADTWRERPDLADRVMRLFGGLDTDRPGARELMNLWGVTRPGTIIRNASTLIKRSAGELLFDRLNVSS